MQIMPFQGYGKHSPERVTLPNVARQGYDMEQTTQPQRGDITQRSPPGL